MLSALAQTTVPVTKATNAGTGNVRATQPIANPTQPVTYQIRLKGHLGEQWSASFEEMTITLEENGDTLLTGPLAIRPHCMACSKKYVI